jgi:hypothetical protein
VKIGTHFFSFCRPFTVGFLIHENKNPFLFFVPIKQFANFSATFPDLAKKFKIPCMMQQA